MYIKKLFYKLTNKDKHFHYKMNLKKSASVKQNIEMKNCPSLNKFISLIMQNLLLELTVQHLLTWHFVNQIQKLLK